RGRGRPGAGSRRRRDQRTTAGMPGRGLRGERVMEHNTNAGAGASQDRSLAAALAAVQLIPSEVPLTVRPATDSDSFTPGDPAVVASFVGGVSADLVVIVDQSIDRALEGAAAGA